MVTGQSLVLYSRLHFVMHRPKLLRYVLAMIVANAIWLGIPVIVLVCGSISTKPDAFEPVYAVFEKVQLSVFTVQELVLSGLYIIETTRILKVQKGLAPAGPRRVMGYLYSSTSLLCFSTSACWPWSSPCIISRRRGSLLPTASSSRSSLAF